MAESPFILTGITILLIVLFVWMTIYLRNRHI